MRKFIYTLALTFVLITPAFYILPAAAATPVKVTVNGTAIQFPDDQPYIDENSKTLVPVRFVSESLKAAVTWEPDGQKDTVSIKKDSSLIYIKVGDASASVNGKAVDLGTKAVKPNGRVLVPLRFVSECLGAKVDWIDSTKTVAITAAGVTVTPASVFDYNKPYIESDGAAIKLTVEDLEKIDPPMAKLKKYFPELIFYYLGDEYTTVTYDKPGVLGYTIIRINHKIGTSKGRIQAVEWTPFTQAVFQTALSCFFPDNYNELYEIVNYTDTVEKMSQENYKVGIYEIVITPALGGRTFRSSITQ